MAGVALKELGWLRWRTWVPRLAPWSPPLFAWPAWHWTTSTVILRGRCGALRHRSSLCVARVALMARGDWLGSRLAPWSPPLFAWQAWRFATATVTLRDRSGTWRHRRAFCVAGVDWSWDVFACEIWVCFYSSSCSFPTSLCGILVFGRALPPLRSPSRPPARRLLMWPHNFLTHNLSTHNLLPRNLLTHNLSTHNLLPHNLSPYNLLTHNLSPHNLLTHNLSTQPSPHNLLTHNLSTHNLLPHNLSTHNLLPHRRAFCLAGVALGDIDLHFAWQAWHLWHWTAWAPFGAVVAAAVCVAGVALGDIDRHFVCRAWHLVTSAVTLPGRSYGTGLALVVCLGPVWHRGRRGCLRGSCSTWQAWHLVTSTVTLRGWRGTYGTWLAPVARLGLVWRHGCRGCSLGGVALGDIDCHFAWQAWHLVTSTVILRGRGGTCGTGLAPVARLGPVWRRGRRGCLRDSCSTWRHRPSLCVASVALMALVWVRWHTHTTLPHNFVTDSFHTQLCHTSLSHTHNFVTHNSFTHNFATYISFTHNLLHTTLSHNSFTHNTFTYTNLHTQHCHAQLFHPTCLAPSPFLPAFPISFSHLLVIIGRSWFVGLSGPLILPCATSLLAKLAGLHRFKNRFRFCKKNTVINFRLYFFWRLPMGKELLQ